MFGALLKVGSKIGAGAKGLGAKGLGATKGLGGKALGFGTTAWHSAVNSVKDFVKSPLEMYKAFRDWSFKHKSLMADEIIRLSTDAIANRTEDIQNSLPVEDTDPRLQSEQTLTESRLNNLTGKEIDQKREALANAPDIQPPRIDLSSDEKIKAAADSIISLVKLNDRIEELRNKQDENVGSIIQTEGIIGIAKGVLDLARTCHRILVLQTYVKDYVVSISSNQALLADADREMKAKELEFEAEKYRENQSFELHREELQEKRDKFNKLRHYELKKQNEEIRDKVSKIEKESDSVGSLTNFIMDIGGFMTVGTRLLEELMKSVGFTAENVESEEDEEADLTTSSGVIDFLNSMFGGVDFSKMQDQGTFKNLQEGLLNIPRIIKNNINQAYKFGNQLGGPLGGMMAGGLVLSGLPITLTLGMGSSLVKMVKDLVIGLSEVPMLGKAMSKVARVFGYETNFAKRDGARLEAEKRKAAFMQGRKDFKEGKLTATQLVELGKRLKEAGKKYAEMANTTDTYSSIADAFYSNNNIDEEAVLAQEKAYKEGLLKPAVSATEFAEATKGNFRKYDFSNVMSPRAPMPDDDVYGPSTPVAELSPNDIEAQGEEVEGPLPNQSLKTAKGGFNFPGWDPRLLVKGQNVKLNSLRMGPLQSSWIADAYEDAGLDGLSVVTSAVRGKEDQSQLNPNSKGTSTHEVGRGLDLRVGQGLSSQQQIRNGVAVMRNLFQRMEMEGVDPNDYRAVIHNVINKDGKDGGLHTHLEYLGPSNDESGDLNIGTHSQVQETAFKHSTSSKRKGNDIRVNYKDIKTGKDIVPWTSFMAPNGKYSDFDPTSETGDPEISESSSNETYFKAQAELIARTNVALSKKLDGIEANIISAMSSLAPKPSVDATQFMTAPRRGI